MEGQISPDKNRAIIGSLRRRSSWKGIEELKSDINNQSVDKIFDGWKCGTSNCEMPNLCAYVSFFFPISIANRKGRN